MKLVFLMTFCVESRDINERVLNSIISSITPNVSIAIGGKNILKIALSYLQFPVKTQGQHLLS